MEPLVGLRRAVVDAPIPEVPPVTTRRSHIRVAAGTGRKFGTDMVLCVDQTQGARFGGLELLAHHPGHLRTQVDEHAHESRTRAETRRLFSDRALSVIIWRRVGTATPQSV